MLCLHDCYTSCCQRVAVSKDACCMWGRCFYRCLCVSYMNMISFGLSPSRDPLKEMKSEKHAFKAHWCLWIRSNEAELNLTAVFFLSARLLRNVHLRSFSCFIQKSLTPDRQRSPAFILPLWNHLIWAELFSNCHLLLTCQLFGPTTGTWPLCSRPPAQLLPLVYFSALPH